MLIEFSVKNFRSIKERQTFSMAATKGSELEKTNTVSIDDKEPRLVRSAAIYGPNASGKTNLIAAIETMRSIVVDSARESTEGEELPVKPFLFNRTSRRGPTEFEAIFIKDGVRYQYGYAATRKRIVEEWLIAHPSVRAQRWYERQYNSSRKSDEWHFGGKLSGNRFVWRDATRSNALYLSTAVQLNSEQLRPVYEWFESTLKVIGIGNLYPGFTAYCLEKGDYSDGIHRLLKAADIGIAGVEVDKHKFSPEDLPPHLSKEQKDMLTKQLEGQELYDVRLLHEAGRNGETVALDIEEESAGTQKLFGYAGPLLDVCESGHVLIVDELSNSLHPYLTRFIVKLFHNSKVNKSNAQLIFTTHDTANLDEKLFRRDQIWLTEADERDRSTILRPLTDFRPRKGVESFARNYLHGRYGALPYIAKSEEPWSDLH